MRIDAFNSTNQIAADQNLQQVSSRAGARAALTGPEDHATLSADSASLSSLTAKALQSPAVRQDRIDALRQAVSNGDYQISSTAIAASMVDENA